MSVKIPRALTIAGSDSGGGAGIQADLKTFAALGVHGMTALTAITAQNTLEVTAIQDVDLEMIRAQIRAVVEDIGVDAAKTGMLHTGEIIEAVVDEIRKHDFPVVVDPVMIAKSGAVLLQAEAKATLIEKLLPISKVVTPNAMEAEAISGIVVGNLEDGKRAAERINDMGPEAVVVKGGHIIEREGLSVDILLHQGEFNLLEAPRYDTKDTHGTGCSFSSAIAAELAKGNDVVNAVRVAKGFVNHSIRFGLHIGKGHGPLNPMAGLYIEAEKYAVLTNLREAVNVLEGAPEIAALVPEVRINIGMALPYAKDRNDVAAIEGRITRLRTGVRAVGYPDFGVSGHVARTVLAVMSYDPGKRAAINMMYSEEILDACRSLSLLTSYYDRREEPPDVKEREGMTTFWGAGEAVKRVGRVPDVIYHFGDHGKEPVMTIIGGSATEVAETAVKVAKRLASEP
jgi:hydroxymethylpyrimidine/phosphomethylpyrimidine kinase